MLAPVLLGLPVGDTYTTLGRLGLQAVAAASIHTLVMLAVMGTVAIVVYEKVGLRVLRRGWFNLDLAWSVTLVGAGAVTMFT